MFGRASFRSWLGISSENAAHRIAVEWDEGGERREGVYIPRRDTSSRLNALVGGRLFPGVHRHARFEVREHGDHYRVAVHSDDGRTHLAVEGVAASELPASSVFRSVAEASEFFRRGSLGYSATATPGLFDGLELRTFDWRGPAAGDHGGGVQLLRGPGNVPGRLGGVGLRLLMRGVEHEWHGRAPLLAAAA